MDLNKLTLADLATLRAGIDAIAHAGKQLSEAGLEPVISLGDRETVLRTSALLGELGQGEEVIEPIRIEPAPPRSAEPVTEAPRDRGESATLQSGPFSDAERATILLRHDASESARQIAVQLGRKTGTVTMLLRQLLKKRGQDENNGSGSGNEAPVPPPGKARAPAAPTAKRSAPADKCIGSPQGVSSVVATAKCAPGGKDTQTSEAAKAPQSAAAEAGPRKPAPAMGHPTAPAGAPVFRPADLHGFERNVWKSIAALKAVAGIDAETDFDLVDGLMSGRALAELALDLDIDAGKLRARFDDLTACIRNERDQIRVGGQPALRRVLQFRMLQERGRAA
ncbi:helix-turn-helix domain-containing protein [Pararhodobacter sp. CCB-MM2]|uniref:helix-turn-helix domain-containing protein n=1 Tax=Pararhodobacter sp. CCB-MM2 TaxID=1786003 RepID=UPI00082B7987|nr:helix-turn-helix domain-containing protein [Pararhodobacter sp. CCB-MM2]